MVRVMPYLPAAIALQPHGLLEAEKSKNRRWFWEETNDVTAADKARYSILASGFASLGMDH